MAEKQTIEEFHFKTKEIIKALRDTGYELPDGESPRMSIGNDETNDVVVLRFGVKAYDGVTRSEDSSE